MIETYHVCCCDGDDCQAVLSLDCPEHGTQDSFDTVEELIHAADVSGWLICGRGCYCPECVREVVTKPLTNEEVEGAERWRDN